MTTIILPSGPSSKGGNQEVKGTAWGGKVTSSYGYRTHPVTGEKGSFHGGTDIASAKGTKIPSNVSGKVIASGSAKSFGYDSSFGNIVVVQDSKGNKHLYGHMNSTTAKVGSKVSKGALLGTVGTTGRSTGPHLHYQVIKGGKTVNPGSWMA